jgi:hypothetical protein
LTHIVLTVAERGGAEGLVTKVEEPAAGAKSAKASAKKAETAKAATTKATRTSGKKAGK